LYAIHPDYILGLDYALKNPGGGIHSEEGRRYVHLLFIENRHCTGMTGRFPGADMICISKEVRGYRQL
jgi:hypothetical protein